MANIIIRDLPDITKDHLRVQAAQAGLSLEAYARVILNDASRTAQQSEPDILSLADQYFGGEKGIDLDLQPRHSNRGYVDFSSVDA